MPLSDDSFRPQAQARRSAARPASPDAPEEDRIGELEARLVRLETGQRSALDLVRQALNALKENQAEQDAAHQQAIARLEAQLAGCETALTRLEASQKRDDEAMRERLFDMGEALEGVRAAAASAVRPGALHKLERTLEREIGASAQSLRTEFGDRLAEAVEAAESRSARALDALEENFWDDLTEMARRFDCVADTVVKVRLELENRGGERGADRPVFSHGETAADPGPEEESFVLPQSETAAETRPDTPSGVIPFPPRQTAPEEDGRMAAPANVGAVLSAAARRVDAAEEAEPAPEAGAVRRGPLGRVASSAGSAVMAVCIMGGLSLLAGPTLGPSFQGAPPAFAQSEGGWTPVAADPEPVTLTLHLDPVPARGGEPHPVREAGGVTSGR